MRIVEQTVTPQVLVYAQTTDDAGDYAYQDTYPVAGALPAKGAKEREEWDAERAKEITARREAWYAGMIAPVKVPTKAEMVADLASAQREVVAQQAKVMTLTAKIAAVEARA
jgi:hypothetical protein